MHGSVRSFYIHRSIMQRPVRAFDVYDRLHRPVRVQRHGRIGRVAAAGRVRRSASVLRGVPRRKRIARSCRLGVREG